MPAVPLLSVHSHVNISCSVISSYA